MIGVPTIEYLLDEPSWGDECPLCGDPFSPAKSGVIWPDRAVSRDAFAWDRVCQSDAPAPVQEFIDELDEAGEYDNMAFAYVHTVSDTA